MGKLVEWIENAIEEMEAVFGGRGYVCKWQYSWLYGAVGLPTFEAHVPENWKIHIRGVGVQPTSKNDYQLDDRPLEIIEAEIDKLMKYLNSQYAPVGCIDDSVIYCNDVTYKMEEVVSGGTPGQSTPPNGSEKFIAPRESFAANSLNRLIKDANRMADGKDTSIYESYDIVGSGNAIDLAKDKKEDKKDDNKDDDKDDKKDNKKDDDKDDKKSPETVATLSFLTGLGGVIALFVIFICIKYIPRWMRQRKAAAKEEDTTNDEQKKQEEAKMQQANMEQYYQQRRAAEIAEEKKMEEYYQKRSAEERSKEKESRRRERDDDDDHGSHHRRSWHSLHRRH